MPPAESPISRQPSLREDSIAILRNLRDSGHVAYLAGGCVRDMLLGIDPKDFDVATDAPPDRVRSLFSNTQAVGAKFGVILVRQGKSVIEVATFRADGDYEDGRRPREVRFTTAEEDARRRDFTINGLFLDPLKEVPIEQQVIDYVGGREDLQKRIIRAIGDAEARFSEDHLRLLRALRFAARLEFEIEPVTAAAIQHHARHLARISPERIAEELRMMLTRFNATWAWYKMVTEFSGLADVIFRFAGDPPPAERRNARIFEYLAPDETFPFALSLAEISLNWAMMQHPDRDVYHALEPSNIRQMVRALRQSLRISNEEVDQMTGTLEGAGILLNKRPMPVAVAKRFLARDTAAMSRRLLADLVCFVGKPILEETNQLLNDFSKTDFAPPPLITGDDLVAQGMRPGKAFKDILDETYDAQLEDRVRDKVQALEFAMQIARTKDGPHPNPSTPRSPRQQEYRERGQEGH